MAKKSGVGIMQYPVQVEISRPELELSPSLSHLDVAQLSKAASAEIEIGSIKSDCCRQRVRASIRKGKVTALYAEPCAASRPPSADLAKLVKAARRKATGQDKPPKWKPMPVADFLQNVSALSGDAWGCVRICILGFCFLCCSHLVGGRTVCMAEFHLQ